MPTSGNPQGRGVWHPRSSRHFCRDLIIRGSGPRWRADRPYHVALEDRYIREHWDEIDALCKLNSLPFNATGEIIESDGVWRDYEFT